MVYKADEPIEDWTDEVPRTCGVAFCKYPEEECMLDALNPGPIVDASEVVWLQDGHKCLEMKLHDHDQPEEEPEPVDPVPEWQHAGDRLLVMVVCPVAQCDFQTSYFDGVDEDESRQYYRDHWMDNHG